MPSWFSLATNRDPRARSGCVAAVTRAAGLVSPNGPRLSISEATVKTHVNNIFSKAHLRDRAQAVVYAVRHDLA